MPLLWTCNARKGSKNKEKVLWMLRESPNPLEMGMRTQADHLPTFMKIGKNRNKIVKLLKEMSIAK